MIGEHSQDAGNWRRIGLFIVGATLLLLELEWRADDTRWIIVGLALLLMGAVTIDQLREWGLVPGALKKKNGDHYQKGIGEDGTPTQST